MPPAASTTPGPPWAPTASGGAGTPDPRRRATLLAISLLGAASLLLLGWWLTGVITLGPQDDDIGCSTTLPAGAFSAGLMPVHAIAGLLLTVGLVALAAARPPGATRTAGLVAPVAVGVALLLLAVFDDALVSAAIGGVVVLPVAVAAAVVVLVLARRGGAGAWPRRALAVEVLLWPALVCGLPLNAVLGTLTYADLFCF